MNLSALAIILLTYLSDLLVSLWPWQNSSESMSVGSRFMLALAIPAAFAICYVLIMRLCVHAMNNRGSIKAMAWAARLHSVSLPLITMLYAVILASTNLLGIIRGWIGDLVLIDECLAILIPVTTILITWWAYYPIARRWREAMLIRSLDSGKPIYPVPTRRHYMASQFRIHLGIMMVPALVIMGWTEAVAQLADHLNWPVNLDARDGMVTIATFIGAAVIFIFAPVFMRLIWQTTPLAQGDLRSRLENLCHSHKVKIRNLLLWHTDGGLINGAVMGLVGSLRYILLTDALIDNLTTPEIEAVMAHEVGHARRHHLPWLVVCLIGIMSTASVAATAYVTKDSRTIGTASTLVPVQSAQRALPATDQNSNAMILPASFAQDQSTQDSFSGVAGRFQSFFERMLRAEELKQEEQEQAKDQGAVLFAALFLGLPAFFWVNRRFERQADTFAVQHLSGMTRDSTGKTNIAVSPEAVQTMQGALRSVAVLNNVPPRKRSARHGSIQWRIDYLETLVGQPCNRLAIDKLMWIIKIASVLLVLGSVGIAYWLQLPM